MVEDLESDLTGAPIDASNTDDVTLDEVEKSDEAITAETKASNEMGNYYKKEQNTESYQYKMNIDIENINTTEQ